jgi:zinc transporter ZupT
MHGKLQHGHDNVTASAAPEKLRRKQRVSHERQFGADINDEDDEDQRQHIRFGGSEGEDDNNEEEDKNNTLTPLELRKMSMDILLLEAGILFHSVFVGITLSIATRGFWMLLLAFSFHQLFEGLGLGARIAAVPFVKRSLRPWMLVLAFGLTAPGGQAIGLGLHDWYDPGSAVALVLNGVFNSM